MTSASNKNIPRFNRSPYFGADCPVFAGFGRVAKKLSGYKSEIEPPAASIAMRAIFALYGHGPLFFQDRSLFPAPRGASEISNHSRVLAYSIPFFDKNALADNFN